MPPSIDKTRVLPRLRTMARSSTLWASTIIIFNFVSLVTIFLQARLSGIDFLEQALFLRSDKPFIPNVGALSYPAPVFGDHYFGDLLHVWLAERELGLPGYYGASSLVVTLLSYLPSYPLVVVIYTIGTGGVIVILILLLRAISFGGRFTSGDALLFVVLLLSWPNIFAFDRGQIHLLQSLTWVTFGAVLFLHRSIPLDALQSKRLIVTFLFFAFGAAASAKIYPAGLLILLAAAPMSKFKRVRLVAPTAFIGLACLPALLRPEGISYLFPRGEAAELYFSASYFENSRNYNFSLFVVLVELFPQWSSWIIVNQTPVFIALSTVIWIMVWFRFREECQFGLSHVQSSFLAAAATSIVIPISAPYTLSVFSLPILVHVWGLRDVQGNFFSVSISRIGQYGDGVLVALSLALVLPSQLILPLSKFDGRFVGSSLYPFFIATALFAVATRMAYRALRYVTSTRLRRSFSP